MDLTNLTLAIAEARDANLAAQNQLKMLQSPAADRNSEVFQAAVWSALSALEKVCVAVEQFAQEAADQIAALIPPPAPTPTPTQVSTTTAPATVSSAAAPATVAP